MQFFLPLHISSVSEIWLKYGYLILCKSWALLGVWCSPSHFICYTSRGSFSLARKEQNINNKSHQKKQPVLYLAVFPWVQNPFYSHFSGRAFCSGLRCISAFLLRNVPKCCPLAAGPDRCWGPWWAGERVGSGTSLFWRIFLNRLTTEVPTISVEQKHVRIEDCDSQWQIS